MGDLIAALILAVVQGITEWLPISSSGHLVLFEHFLGYNGSLLFEVALHFGTLMAVFVYFGKDIVDIAREVLSLRLHSTHGRLGVLVIVGSIPAGIVGFLFLDFFERLFESLTVSAWGFAITGVLLLIASLDRWGGSLSSQKKLPSVFDAFIIGSAQAIAIVPGISRAGSTIAAGLLRGLDAKDAARFSFLLAIPVIFGANIVVIGNTPLPRELIWATLVAFAVGLVMIHFMFKVVLTSKKNLRWFGIYALALATAVGAYAIAA